MAANEALKDLSLTDGSNTPGGGDAIAATADDELRSIKANIARSARWQVTATVSAAATFTETILHKLVPVSGSAAGSTTVTLPTVASAGTGFAAMFVKVDATNNVVVDGSGAETIEGSANATLTQQYESVVLVSEPGVGWHIASASRRWRGDLNVEGDTSLSGSVFMKSTLDVSGTASLGVLVVGGTTTAVGAVVAKAGVTIEGTLTASGTAVFKTVSTFEGPGRATITTLSDGATIAVDFADSNDFTVTLGGNRTMGQPSNQVAGQSGVIYIVQDATGSRTLTWHADWKWAGGTAPTLSTGANDVDAVSYHVRSANNIVAVFAGANFS